MRDLVLQGIEKRFPNGVVACDGIDLTIRAGEVVALLGENGAGKTTLMRICTGVTRADRGRIVLDGEPLQLGGPRDAILRGINMVHQHFMLIPRLSAAENVVLGFEGAGWVLDRARVRSVVGELAERTGLQVDVGRPVEELAVGEQQRVEILRALYQGAEVLILDEPTAVLTPPETEALFRVVRRLVSEHKAVVFISHKLHEVSQIADRVVVLRRGEVVGERAPDTPAAELASLMIGAALEMPRRAPRAGGTAPGGARGPGADAAGMPSAAGSTAAADMASGELAVTSEARGAAGGRSGPVGRASACPVPTPSLVLRAVEAAGSPGLRGLDLLLRAGEIVGLAGVDGNGQTELEQVIAGVRAISAGTLEIEGTVHNRLDPRHARRLGIVRIPSDRHREGLVEGASIWENLALFDLPQFLRRGVLDVTAARRRAERLVSEFDVRCSSVDQPAGELSGGNQQKLVIARELSAGPRVVVAAQPTRGLDVGAAATVHRTLVELREAGAAVLLISADLDEVCRLADRVAVLFNGRVIGEGAPDERDRIGQLMAGVAA